MEREKERERERAIDFVYMELQHYLTEEEDSYFESLMLLLNCRSQTEQSDNPGSGKKMMLFNHGNVALTDHL